METKIETFRLGEQEIKVKIPVGMQVTENGKDFSKQLETMIPVIKAAKEKIDTLGDHKPSEVTLEFSITIGLEAGVIAAKATAESTIGVSCTWEN